MLGFKLLPFLLLRDLLCRRLGLDKAWDQTLEHELSFAFSCLLRWWIATSFPSILFRMFLDVTLLVFFVVDYLTNLFSRRIFVKHIWLEQVSYFESTISQFANQIFEEPKIIFLGVLCIAWIQTCPPHDVNLVDEIHLSKLLPTNLVQVPLFITRVVVEGRHFRDLLN